MKALRNESGFCVILLCLMVLLTMTALGTAMLQTSMRELKSVNKLKLSQQAFYSAESGNNIVTAEIDNIDPDSIDATFYSDRLWLDDFVDVLAKMSTPDMLVLDGNNYPFVAEATDYNLDMRFKTSVEFLWDGSDPGTILCYGYKDDGSFTFVQDTFQSFSDAGVYVGHDFWPVIKLTSIGTEGRQGRGLFKYAERNVQTQIRAKPQFVFPEAALVLNGTLSNSGNPQSAIGEGHPDDTTHCNVFDIVGTNESVNSYTGNDGICVDETTGKEEPCHTANPQIKDDAAPYPVIEVAAALRSMGEEVINPPNNPNFSEEKIRWYDGDLTINNLDGNGILVVSGDFTVGGNIAWSGLIIVTGDFVMNGGGTYTKYIHGSVIVGGDTTGNGNPDIYYDCDRIVNLWKASARFKQDWWKEIPGRI